MNEQALRALVREAVARRLGASADRVIPSAPGYDRMHASHRLLPVPAGADTGDSCLIEPAVNCVHCGYCQSFGH